MEKQGYFYKIWHTVPKIQILVLLILIIVPILLGIYLYYINKYDSNGDIITEESTITPHHLFVSMVIVFSGILIQVLTVYLIFTNIIDTLELKKNLRYVRRKTSHID